MADATTIIELMFMFFLPTWEQHNLVVITEHSPDPVARRLDEISYSFLLELSSPVPDSKA
jgi:hypothetical protein